MRGGESNTEGGKGGKKTFQFSQPLEFISNPIIFFKDFSMYSKIIVSQKIKLKCIFISLYSKSELPM